MECPLCNGSGRFGRVPMKDGTTMTPTCYICIGVGSVPDWDYERLNAMVKETYSYDGIQVGLNLQ